MKTSVNAAHPLKEMLREKKIRLWMLRNLTGVPESRLSRFLNGIDPMPRQLEIQIFDLIFAIEGKFMETKQNPELEAEECQVVRNRIGELVKAVMIEMMMRRP